MLKSKVNVLLILFHTKYFTIYLDVTWCTISFISLTSNFLATTKEVAFVSFTFLLWLICLTDVCLTVVHILALYRDLRPFLYRRQNCDLLVILHHRDIVLGDPTIGDALHRIGRQVLLHLDTIAPRLRALALLTTRPVVPLSVNNIVVVVVVVHNEWLWLSVKLTK